MTTNIGGIPIIFGDRRQPKALPLSHPKARYGGFHPGKTILRKGHQKKSGCLALPCDIVFERDVAVTLRDGTKIYVDVYRPHETNEKVPAIIAWSPYGKEGGAGNQVLDDFPFRMGIPLSELSELQKWEGPDPAFWVNKGYAVVNPDPRGTYKSEGNIYQWGTQEGRDGADVVDWVGEQEWCSGKVTLSGNSYLTISQWFIAAERPKHLACIAPWEGFTDIYGEAMLAGGCLSKAALDFGLKIFSVNVGENTWENVIQMGIDHKIHGSYHKDKAARVERINVPAYVVASWSNPIHVAGTFSGYTRLQSDKWLRIHDSWEWPDYYQHENRDDLLRFFDHFMKGIDNGWEETPRVRMKIIDTASTLPLTGTTVIADEFPPIDTDYLQLNLHESGQLLKKESSDLSMVTYEAQNGQLDFSYTFEEDCTLCGQLEMQLWVSVDGMEDTDIFIYLEKELVSGAIGYQLTVPYQKWWQSWLIRCAHYLGLSKETNAIFYRGPEGRIRLSRRREREDLAALGLHVPRMDSEMEVKRGELYVVKPGFTPIGMHFSKGEKLKIRISGRDTHSFPPVDQATLEVEGITDINSKGTVAIYCGELQGLSSHIVLPILPRED